MPSEDHFPASHPLSETISIPASSDTSSSIKIFNKSRLWNVSLIYVITPSGLQGTKLSLEMSEDGSTWYPVYDDEGNEISISTTSTARCIRVYPTEVAGLKHIRFVSDSSQGAERTLTIGLYIV